MDVFAETDQRLATQGVTLWVAGLPTRSLEKVKRTAAWEVWVERGKVHATVASAVAAHEARR